MKTYYNEFDPKAAAWLRELITGGHIPAGDVDTRSIVDVKPEDLYGYDQCHFFAGIGGWAYALQLAGWSGPVWTGSCPCQPFSIAGAQRGTADERHLWPQFARLIAECRPPVVFGEQVASKAGREWLAGVRADLEGMAYAVGAADLCAAGVGSPHIRQRLFWVADTWGLGLEGGGESSGEGSRGSAPWEWRQRSPVHGGSGGVAHPTDTTGQQGVPRANVGPVSPSNGGDGFWSDYELIPCRDGKVRRIEPGTFPLAYGVSGRVGLLRGYGNAIVPEVAAEFVSAFREG